MRSPQRTSRTLYAATSSNSLLRRCPAAAWAILAAIAVGPADAGTPDGGNSADPDRYLSRSGRLKERLYVQCEAVGGARGANSNATVSAKLILNIARDGSWTYLNTLGVGVSDVGFAGFLGIKGRQSGRLAKDSLQDVANILQRNDFATLPRYSNAARSEQSSDSAVVKAKITISFGNRTAVCFLLERRHAGQTPFAVDKGDSAAEVPQEITARYEDIYQSLLAIAGVAAKEAGTP